MWRSSSAPSGFPRNRTEADLSTLRAGWESTSREGKPSRGAVGGRRTTRDHVTGTVTDVARRAAAPGCATSTHRGGLGALRGASSTRKGTPAGALRRGGRGRDAGHQRTCGPPARPGLPALPAEHARQEHRACRPSGHAASAGLSRGWPARRPGASPQRPSTHRRVAQERSRWCPNLRRRLRRMSAGWSRRDPHPSHRDRLGHTMVGSPPPRRGSRRALGSARRACRLRISYAGGERAGGPGRPAWRPDACFTDGSSIVTHANG